MRSLCCIILMICGVFHTHGQEIEVLAVLESNLDSSDFSKLKYDINQNQCALLEVHVDSTPNIMFSGNIIGDVESDSAGVYLLNVASGTKRITFRHKDYLPGVIDFPQYNVKIFGNKKYIVYLKPSATKSQPRNTSKLQYLTFMAESPIESVVVNGESWVVSYNQSKKMVPLGHYEYVIKSKNMKMCKGHVDVSNAGIGRTVRIKFE